MNKVDVIEDGGEFYMRISSVLGCFRFPDDYESSDLNKLHEAGRIGKQVHSRIEKLARGEKITEPNGFEAKTAWNNFIEWKDMVGFQLEGKKVEQRYFHRELGITGCVDYMDSFGVIDWKTSGKLLVRHWIQANAYVALIWPPEEWEGKVVRLVRFDKNNRLWDDQSQTFDRDLWNWTVQLIAGVSKMYGVENFTVTV